MVVVVIVVIVIVIGIGRCRPNGSTSNDCGAGGTCTKGQCTNANNVTQNPAYPNVAAWHTHQNVTGSQETGTIDLVSNPKGMAFEQWLHDSEYDRINFDSSYVDHLRKFHGGVPGKRYFETALGTGHVLERFLNFLPSGSNHPLEQYSVACTWSMIDDRLGAYLMPFAELFAGDMLCFDFEKHGPPEVVVWFHELSEQGRPIARRGAPFTFHSPPVQSVTAPTEAEDTCAAYLASTPRV